MNTFLLKYSFHLQIQVQHNSNNKGKFGFVFNRREECRYQINYTTHTHHQQVFLNEPQAFFLSFVWFDVA